MNDDSQDSFITGQRIDRYEVREHIGQGGMGAVYRALDTRLGRSVAIKTVVAHRRGDRLTEEIRERFTREALAASRVDHRNVVQVLDFGFADDGTPYIVMEYLRGQSLSAVLEKAKEPLAPDYVADVMLSVCAALRACHHAGIIHRDLKPANIFLCDTDTGWEVKVLDFGISKAPASGPLTQEGQIIGTPQYLSPEQISGNVAPASDQYALGVLLYVCLTGQLPYAQYQSVRLLRAISEGKFDPPRRLRPDLAEGLEAIILRAMHVSPEQRFESIHALGQRLWEFASPRGQGQWRSFYFHAPAGATPASPAALTGARPGEPGRDRAVPGAGSGAPSSFGAAHRPRPDATASLEAASALANTQGQPSTVGPSVFAATKTAAASALGEATGFSHSDIAGESAHRDAHGATERRGAGRGALWGVALAALAATCAGIVVAQRPWRRAERQLRPPASSEVMPAGSAIAPAAPPARPLVAPALPPTAPPAAPPVVPAAPAASPPVVAEPPAAPAPPSASTAPAPSAKKAARPAPVTKKKHATHRRAAPKTDQHGIGIPDD